MGRTSSGDQIEILKFYVCLIGIGNIICYPFFIEPSQIPKKVTAFPLSKDTTGGRGGVVNTYGQPDRKYPFFGDFLSWVPKRKMSLEGAGLKEKHPKGFVTDSF